MYKLINFNILKLNVETFFLNVSVVTTYSATVFMQLECFDFIVNVEYIEYSKIWMYYNCMSSHPCLAHVRFSYTLYTWTLILITPSYINSLLLIDKPNWCAQCNLLLRETVGITLKKLFLKITCTYYSKFQKTTGNSVLGSFTEAIQ